MSFEGLNYKDVIYKIINCPSDGRTKSARDFWKKETILFKKLFKKYSNPNFWSNLSLFDTSAKNGKIPSLALFFDKKNNYWAKVLEKKWRGFHWVPPKTKSYNFKQDIFEPTNYKIKKKNIRDFFN